jgi:hypothetical protein
MNIALKSIDLTKKLTRTDKEQLALGNQWIQKNIDRISLMITLAVPQIFLNNNKDKEFNSSISAYGDRPTFITYNWWKDNDANSITIKVRSMKKLLAEINKVKENQ